MQISPYRHFALLLIAALLCCATSLRAQSASVVDTTTWRSPQPLGGVWLVKAGDDPAYASPALDDSGWQAFDAKTSITALYGKERPAVVWYRLHLKVDPAQTSLALNEHQISQAFELFANGERIMRSGTVIPFHPYTMDAYVLAPLPSRLLTTGVLVLALRVHISQADWGGQNPGYYANNLFLGDRETLYRGNWLAVIGDNAVHWLDRILLITLGVVALVLMSGQRQRNEYFWMAALGAITLISFPQPFIAAFQNMPVYWKLLSGLPRGVFPFVLAGIYFAFAHKRLTRPWKVFLAVTGLMNLVVVMHGVLFTLPPLVELAVELPTIILFAVVIPSVLGYEWHRRGNREAGLLLWPALLFSLYIYLRVVLIAMFQFPQTREAALNGITLLDQSHVGPIVVPFNDLFDMLSTLALTVILLQRSSTSARRQALLESELAAAQQVQQVLIPEQDIAIPGFAVESIYLPAQEVGGDFFQIIPDEAGGMLIVLGDVAGKGLPAAMLVSVIVGAARATAEFTVEPSLVLRNLNDRLVGRAGGAFSTALVAHVSAHGQVRIANAGQLQPYVDGREIELPGALPLGVQPGTEYQEIAFELSPGSRLTLYSDGVVEAQSRTGELLGFERARDLARKNAREIAEAAQDFGQEDDITVLTIDRVPAHSAIPIAV